jgi:hypothetical protein
MNTDKEGLATLRACLKNPGAVVILFLLLFLKKSRKRTRKRRRKRRPLEFSNTL